jgi:hypothetical protein
MSDALTIRAATPGDEAALRRLAALDSSAPLHGPSVLAERDDVAVAAVALTSGDVIADPFRRTADAVHMLRLRRYLLVRQSNDVGPGWLLLRRRRLALP